MVFANHTLVTQAEDIVQIEPGIELPPHRHRVPGALRKALVILDQEPDQDGVGLFQVHDVLQA